jgi:hypothetical protein
MWWENKFMSMLKEEWRCQKMMDFEGWNARTSPFSTIRGGITWELHLKGKCSHHQVHDDVKRGMELTENDGVWKLECPPFTFSPIRGAITINPLYNHAHFSHILVCVTHFSVTIHFSKKRHYLESLSHSLVAENFYKAFF